MMRAIALVFLLGACGNVALPDGGKLLPDEWVEHDKGILSADKGKHFLAGMVASNVTMELADHYTTWNRKEQQIAGCAVSTALGFGKEWYDENVMGSYQEPLDIAYTAAGCLFRWSWDF